MFTLSEQETLDLGRSFGTRLRGGELVLLVGDLGLGKTVFARGVALGLGIDGDEVCSPSYTLIQQYDGGRIPMVHVDLYRIEDDDGLLTLGLDELLDSGAVVVVEWGERVPLALRRGAISILFSDLGEGSRRIEIVAGEQSDRTLLDDA